MERITLYHRNEPISYYPLRKSSFSIGSSPDNDLVLAGDRVAERHMVLLRSQDGTWRARLYSQMDTTDTKLSPNTQIAMDAFSIRFESLNGAQGESTSPVIPDLGLVGVSPEMQVLKMNIGVVAPLSAPALISGETGTGKELVARGLHEASGRSKGPFVVVNCGGLTESLLEDTLFGHRRGAFTGATRDQTGVFEQAEGGTLFLDEVGELPLAQQAALLRVLDTRQIKRIGADQPRSVDFRLVSATNKHLPEMVESGAFRADLYHRVSAIKLSTCALRHRPSDIQSLSQFFLTEWIDELGFKQLDEGAVDVLEQHNWPGNVRELRNVLFRAAAFCRSQVIQKVHIEIEAPVLRINRKRFHLNRIPMHLIQSTLQQYGGNVSATARELGVPRSSLRDKLNRLAETG